MRAWAWVNLLAATIAACMVLFVGAGCSDPPGNLSNTGSGPTPSTPIAGAVAQDLEPQDTVPEMVETTTAGKPLDIRPAQPLAITLVDYRNAAFTMQVPQGWALEAVGEYETLGFRLYDPQQPARQIFFYGKMHPFMKSEEGRNAWQQYLQGGGFTGDSQLYATAPVLYAPSTEGFFHTFDEFTAFAVSNGISHPFPALGELEVVEMAPRGSGMGQVALDDSMARAFFTQDGTPCEGLLAATVVDAMYNPLYGVDAGFYYVYAIAGIAAPADEFVHLQDVLAQSLATFRYTDQYIQQGVAQNAWETDMAIAVGNTLAAAYDSYNQAWHARQRAYDALSQKRSDATLGYDRLYDSETGETYRSELGFYDYYDLHREEYTNPDLQLVPDDGYDLYDTPVSGYILK